MIYTITLNPSLDYVVSVKEFQTGKTNRTRKESVCVGGKGINVSKMLRNLGIRSVALGFRAGFTGEEINRQLQEEGIDANLVEVASGYSRINWKLTDIEGTEVNGQGPVISPWEESCFMKKLREIKTADTLFLSGSIPKSLPQDYYGRIMEEIKGKEIQVVLDATGKALLSALPYAPFLIKPNQQELSEIFGKELFSLQDIVAYGIRLQEMGARNVLVSRGGEGAILISEDKRVINASAPVGCVRNTVGAGDAMLAGFMAGWLKRNDYEEAFRMAVAAGSASAFSDSMATEKEVKLLLSVIHSHTMVRF